MSNLNIQQTTNSVNSLRESLYTQLTTNGITIASTPPLNANDSSVLIWGYDYIHTNQKAVSVDVNGHINTNAIATITGTVATTNAILDATVVNNKIMVSGEVSVSSVGSSVATTNTILDKCVTNDEIAVSGTFFQSTQPISIADPIATTNSILDGTVVDNKINVVLNGGSADIGSVEVSNLIEPAFTNLNATSTNGLYTQQAPITLVTSTNNSYTVIIEVINALDTPIFVLGQQILIKGCTTYPILNGLRTIIEVINDNIYKIYVPNFSGTNDNDVVETGTLNSFGQSPLMADEDGNLQVKVINNIMVSGEVSVSSVGSSVATTNAILDGCATGTTLNTHDDTVNTNLITLYTTMTNLYNISNAYFTLYTPTLSYVGIPATLTSGVPVSYNPTKNMNMYNFTSSPVLPTGLSMDYNGIISGTPTTPDAGATYTISAFSNNAGLIVVAPAITFQII